MTDKNVVVGLDCGDPDLVASWSVHHDYHTFKNVMKQGFITNLQSTIPPVTIPAWISMFSGKRPDRLEAFGLMRLMKDYTLKNYLSYQWEGEMLWDIAARQGKKTGIVFLPFFCPSYPVEGFMISNPPSAKEWVYPPELQSDIGKKPTEGITLTKFQQYERIFERKKEIFWNVIDNPVDLLILGIKFLDNVTHMNSVRQLKRAYKKVDTFLSTVYDLCLDQKWNLIIVSDHGCKHVDQLFNVNAFLEKCNMLHHKKLRSQIKIQDLLLEHLPEKVLQLLLKMNPSSNVILPNVIFSETKSFAHDCGGTSSFGGIWINKEGNFNNGFLSLEEAKKTEKSVLKTFHQLNNIVATVYRTHDIYPAAPETTFPDLIFQLQNNIIPFFCPSQNLFFKRTLYAHRRKGLLMGCGPDISKNRPKNARITDIMPTLMHLLGCDIPSNLDGAVLDIFEPGSEPCKRKVTYFDVEETEKIKRAVTKFRFVC